MSIDTVWSGVTSEIGKHVRERTRECLAAYKANRLLVIEHANIERATAQGGYGRRQIYELVQNGADALLQARSGKIVVLLTQDALYCANEGCPITTAGVDAIMSSHLSVKRGAEIGRFGLGFKSVLGVTNSPEVFSRSGSFGFDTSESEKVIRAVVPAAERIPLLRVARPLNPKKAPQDDPRLAELMNWATTVIKLPRDAAESDWLSKDIADFPSEFLLFSPHVGELVLEDRTCNLRRQIRVQKNGDLISLEEAETAVTWRVFGTRHVPSAASKKDGGELADRESLPLMWAVPVRGRSARGKFWSFFPTEYFTTLSGIINAPWKTNEDRQNLLTGVFNQELIGVAAHLVSDNIRHLSEREDPGRYLDLLPARGREAPNWADEAITEKTYLAVSEVACLPDQNGVLRRAGEVNLHPAGLPEAALRAWASAPGRPDAWCHHSIDMRDRRPRADRLALNTGRMAVSVSTWLEALTSKPDPAYSAAALDAAAIIYEANPTHRSEILCARIVLTFDGRYVPPDPRTVFRSDDPDESSDVDLVHPDLGTQEAAAHALEVLGIRQVDVSSSLEALVASADFRKMSADQWHRFWKLTARVPAVQAGQIVGERRRQVHVRTVLGTFEPITHTLIPGPIVPADGSRDALVAIDLEYHSAVRDALREFGATPAPTSGGGSTDESWFYRYRRDALDTYFRLLEGGSRPQEDKLGFSEEVFIGPLEPLFLLSDEGKAQFTQTLLAAAAGEDKWLLRHVTRWDHYPRYHVEPPSYWIARKYGRLQTSCGNHAVTDCVGPSLSEWRLFFPVVSGSEEIERCLNLPDKLQQIDDSLWEQAALRALRINDDAALGRFYDRMCRRLPDLPDSIRCRIGDSMATRPPAEVTANDDPRLAEALKHAAVPFLPVISSAASILVAIWGLVPADRSASMEVRAAPSGPATPLADRFPGLGTYLSDAQASLELVPCVSVRVETVTAAGTQTGDREIMLHENRLYYSDSADNELLLDRITGVLGLELSFEDKDDILQLRVLTEQRERLYEVRCLETLPEKITAAIGTPDLRRRLPAGLTAAAEGEYGILDESHIARLALATFGVDTLYTYREELQKNGFSPPLQWAGSYGARKFVQDLGFTKEFAGFAHARREAVLDVGGPARLPQLHDFQENIVGEIRRLLVAMESTRGLLSLPTGAGKTRVAVEALVQALSSGDIEGPILWVAQSDELCEQAVQSWAEVWRAVGQQTALHLNRLWGANEADWFGDGPHVVVATIQKLQNCIDRLEYDWLKEPSCVIIDEAHLSTEPSYTKLFEWTGLGRRTQRCPLLGLTATPYRGSEDETIRLVSRYSQRLEGQALGDDPYRRLQSMGILAQVDHRILAGADIQLSAQELDELQRLRRLPSTAGERIGRDETRNRALLESIRSLPQDWPVLLFAASVDHAATLAALLTMEGIPAASISAETGAGARRHYIERFRAGSLRVLTNYGVLTTGFDAPAIRAIYVARPTFSPILYQQMIGRGLRGPLNGGKERCLIANVEDNIRQYGEQLAFRQFDYLWNPVAE